MVLWAAVDRNHSARPVRRGSSSCPGRRGCRRRRAAPPPKASAWACAAMDRKPCGPPSHRHQISGPSSAGAQQNQAGLGEPAWSLCGARELTLARGPRTGAWVPLANEGHQQGRPTGRRRWTGGAHGSRSGSSTTPRPSSPSPCRGGRPVTSTMAAAASSIWASRAQVVSDSGCPCASASTAATSPSSRHEAVVVGRQLPVETVGEGVGGECRSAVPPRWPAIRGSGRTRGTRRRRPASRFGDDVVVGRESPGWGRRPGTPGASRSAGRHRRCARTGRPPWASRRAVGGSRSRRSAGCRRSIPLVQCTPLSKVRAPPGTKLSGGSLGVALVLGQPPGGRQHGDVVVPDISQTCLMLPVSVSSR